MSILGDSTIAREIAEGRIVIEPMAPWAVGSNSVDLHLSPHLAVYADLFDSYNDGQPAFRCRRHKSEAGTWEWLEPEIALDTRVDHKLLHLAPIDPDKGFILRPGILYLARTLEYTESGPYLPFLDGTSGAGRLGISVHVTAGKGDVGFKGCWTLELTVTHPVRVYGGEPIGQLFFHSVAGEVRNPYDKKPGASYADAGHGLPQGSRMWKKQRWLGQTGQATPTPDAPASPLAQSIKALEEHADRVLICPHNTARSSQCPECNKEWEK